MVELLIKPKNNKTYYDAEIIYMEKLISPVSPGFYQFSNDAIFPYSFITVYTARDTDQYMPSYIE